MGRAIACFLLVLVLAGCRTQLADDGASIGENSLVYQVSDGRYAVIYIRVEEVSDETAKQNVLKVAAQCAQDHGYRYFSVDKEQNVMVAHTAPNPQTSKFHQNLYQELIIEGDMRRSPYPPGPYPQSATTLPAVKLTITCYQERPNNAAMDACQLVPCP